MANRKGSMTGSGDEPAATSNLPCLDRLREELSCTISLDICFKPSTTPCRRREACVQRRLARRAGPQAWQADLQEPGLKWAIWKNRNKMAIQRTLPNKPTEVMLSGISLVQSWKPLLKEKDRSKVESITEVMLEGVSSFRPWSGNPLISK